LGTPAFAVGLIAGMMVVKSRSSAPPEEVDDAFAAGALALGFTACMAGRDCDAALLEAPAATSRTNPSLSSCAMSFSNSPSKLLPTFCATSPSVARPSMADSTARSARLRRLVLPEASWTPLPDLE
jgi:hypothetical protein